MLVGPKEPRDQALGRHEGLCSGYRESPPHPRGVFSFPGTGKGGMGCFSEPRGVRGPPVLNSGLEYGWTVEQVLRVGKRRLGRLKQVGSLDGVY